MEQTRLRQGFAASVLLVAGMGLAACNSSGGGGGSSSGGGGSGGGGSGPSLTPAQVELALAQAATDFATDATSGDAIGFASFSGAGDSAFEDPRDSEFDIEFTQVGALEDGEFEFCNDGGTFVANPDTPSHVRLEWNNCRNSFSEGGDSFSSVTDGVIESKWEQPGPDGYEYLITTDTAQFSTESSFSFDGSSGSLIFTSNGFASIAWTSGIDYKADINSTNRFAVTCDGDSFDATFGFQNVDILVKPSDDGMTNAGQMEFNGGWSVSGLSPDADGEYTFETLEDIRFVRFNEERPYAGKVRIGGSGQIVEVEYVDAGLLVNGTFYAWDDIEGNEDDDLEFDADCIFG